MAEKKVYEKTLGVMPDVISGFCPGCMHGTVHKLVGEVVQELGMLDKLVRVEGVGCCGLGQQFVSHDVIIAAHGRACAVATGVKRCSPESLVYTYQGDGDLASIGLDETVSAANRGENFTVIFINNGIYGMTGGQMAPTTLIGMKATTAPFGRKVEEHGYPMHVCELLSQLKTPQFLVRTAVDTPQNKSLMRMFSPPDNVEVGCNSVLNPGTVVGRHSNVYPLSMVRGFIPAESILKTGGVVVSKREDV